MLSWFVSMARSRPFCMKRSAIRRTSSRDTHLPYESKVSGR